MQIPGSIRDQAFQTLRAVQQGRLEQLYTSTCFSADHFFKGMHIFQDAAYRDCPHSPQAAELLRSTTERILLFRCRNKWCCVERRGARSRKESKPSTAKNSISYALILQCFYSCLHSFIWIKSTLIGENTILKNQQHITWQIGNNWKQSFQSRMPHINILNCHLRLMHKLWL